MAAKDSRLMQNSKTSAFTISEEPYYLSTGNEIDLFKAAWQSKQPVMLKGPTGCGKTRFVQYMAWHLKRPLITVACHEDLFASDLLGRYLIQHDETVWVDGPLTQAVRMGGICYLDEIVEALKDTTVVIHPLTDARRVLPLEKKGELVTAHPDFQIVISYNPGYQSLMKDLKQSTKQRFGGMNFDYPETAIETEIVTHEGGVSADIAEKLVQVAQRSRNLKGHGLDEGLSTRMLIYAGSLISKGVAPLAAEALDLGDGHALYANFRKRFPHVVELEGLDDGLDLFHVLGTCPMLGGWRSE